MHDRLLVVLLITDPKKKNPLKLGGNRGENINNIRKVQTPVCTLYTVAGSKTTVQSSHNKSD